MGNSESRDASSSSEGSSTLRKVRRSLPPESSKTSVDKVSLRNDRRSASMPVDREVAARHHHRDLPRPVPSRRSSSSSDASSDDRMPRVRGGIEKGQEVTEDTSSQLSYWYLIKHGYTELVHLIIRPPRTHYEYEELGPIAFSFLGQEFVREDFTVVNDRKQKLVCSHWKPAKPSTADVVPCVVYLHGNSSCRLEALSVLRTCLGAGLTVAAFDTAGCGKSDGEYISLGYYERDDLREVVAHLRDKMNIGSVALWGRSMGAATALLHADRDPTIAGIVVDSAFVSLEQLVEEVVERGRQEGMTLPAFLVKIVLKFIRSSVKKRAHFDLRHLAPIDHAPVSFVPALFVAAEHDSFISPHHSDQIYAAYGGDKNLVKVDGDHNTSRPQFLLDSAAIFLQTALQVDVTTAPQMRGFEDDSPGGGGRVPWEAELEMSSMSVSSSPTSSYSMTVDFFDSRYPSRRALLMPTEPWSCASCTFVNSPLSLQCAMCRNIYLPDHDEEEQRDGGNEYVSLTKATRRRALTTGGVRPAPTPRPSRPVGRRQSVEAVSSTARHVASSSRRRSKRPVDVTYVPKQRLPPSHSSSISL
ncbi:hypothetical protein PsorP6_015976 [Peronosclerospora sorghi]|uniref:Uncharacterized protein n=1 Tax=Peronosclerospora sorghi TaxID=230839 RepID=A0ACC0WMG5_9STRA|nr:hypothetical protein PsorP6_015976 [Peronosclerospora sorghi]